MVGDEEGEQGGDSMTEFLDGVGPRRQWQLEGHPGFESDGLYIGRGDSGLEVVVARATTQPTSGKLLDIWKGRRAGRAAPVLLAVLFSADKGGGGAALCGPSGENPPTYLQMDQGLVERLCREALTQPNRHAVLQFLSQALPSLETELPGIHNEGLVALHELLYGTASHYDWDEIKDKAATAANERGIDLLTALDFKVDELDNLTCLLRSGDRRTALAVMLRDTESPEAGLERFNHLSPVSYALAKADSEGLPWVVLVQGNRLRLYATAVDVGVGRRGRTETFIECQPSLLSDKDLPYLWLLYSADALAEGGSLHNILNESKYFAGKLAERLRERVYEEVVPTLAEGIVMTRKLKRPGPKELALTYEMALTVLFRLLFIAYAEDRDLLPWRSNEAYRVRSLKRRAQELAGFVANDTPIAPGYSHWEEVSQLWHAVAKGQQEWGVPAYNGGLFSTDAVVSPAGAEIAKLKLPNATFEVALRALLVIEVTSEGVSGPVDFRSLGVREFGTIYEGLLESELALAEVDLKLGPGNTYVPARAGEIPEVSAGDIYLHNRSGARKSSGSYYTKHFAVEHLLDGALEPALDDHFKRLDELDDTDAAEAFFDFRVADIAMGSGHFLIAAIDRIEKRMADFLANCPLPGVRRELNDLRKIAEEELGDLAEATTIEDGPLLRRMIARRCVYGVDLNPLGVQLARVSVWIHTFVPGLPLSVLDHTLIHGNSLVGVGTIEEIRGKFEETRERSSLWDIDAESLLGKAEKPLKRLANLNDATLKDIEAAREAIQQAKDALKPTEVLCDLMAAGAVSDDERVKGFLFEEWEQRNDDPDTKAVAEIARRELADLHPLHFPVAFPEVFLRKRPGFDVLLGNPPWEKAKVEEHSFWARHFPGFRSLRAPERRLERRRLQEERPDLIDALEAELTEKERMRRALINGNYPGIGRGDPDLYQAFCWRFWRLIRSGGHLGVVLPRSALSGQGSIEFRRTVFEEATKIDITMLLNNRQWVFEELHPQYTIGLVCIARGTPISKPIRLSGPYTSTNAFENRTGTNVAVFDREEIMAWNDSMSLPLLPSDPHSVERSVEVLTQLCKSPQLDMNEEGKWRVRPDSELHASGQKWLMDTVSEQCPEGYWPVYKGESFDHWGPDNGEPYAFADPSPVIDWLQEKRQNARSNHQEFSAEHLDDPQTLPCFSPRIAFRDITNRTNRRTIIPCLIPPQMFITHLGPYFLWPRGDERDQAYLLGVLSSIPCDWYARRFVEGHLVFYLLNSFPVPRPSRDAPGWQRVVELAGRLACPDDRFAGWAKAVGVECGPLFDDEKEDMIHEIDAIVAHLYGLSESQLVHIFETFHERWDYQERLEGVLRHFRAWNGRT